MAGKQEEVVLALTRETFAKLVRTGVEATVTIEAPPTGWYCEYVFVDTISLTSG